MSRGKPVQEGIRVKLPTGYDLGSPRCHDPGEIRDKDLFPPGFMPLPHPNHPEGGWVFPRFHIDEIRRQEGHNLKTERFFKPRVINDHRPRSTGRSRRSRSGDQGHAADLHDGRLLTLDDTVEFFNLIFEPRLPERGRRDLVAFMRQL